MPYIHAILGAQYGDEGKGKFTYLKAKHANVCCRFNGGSNAGHTIVLDSHNCIIKLHQLPCGAAYPNVQNLLGHGMVVNLRKLVEEIKEVSAYVPDVQQRIWISDRAHLLLNFHIEADIASERQRGQLANGQIGTTKQGIGPAYMTKASRDGLRVGDLYDWESFKEKYMSLSRSIQSAYRFDHDAETELKEIETYRKLLLPQIVNGVAWLHAKLTSDQYILIEGANAAMLDIDVGTYPFVTSSSTTIGGAMIGLGLPPQAITSVCGVVKAYTTRVGNGPFVTELNDETGAFLRDKGHEFGATTGRPRRCGWLDIPNLKYVTALNGFTEIYLTKLDVLTGIDPIRCCVAYKTKDNAVSQEFPSTIRGLEAVIPVYRDFKGWTQNLSECASYEDLPAQAKVFIEFIEEELKCPVSHVNLQLHCEQTLCLHDTSD